MNRLRRLGVAGFKSIRELDLELGQINVLIGGNGAGKSNLVSFFRMLNFMMTDGLQDYVGTSGGANSLLHYGAARTPQLPAALEFETGEEGRITYRMCLRWAAPDTLNHTGEVVTHSPPGPWHSQTQEIALSFSRKESQLLEMGESGVGPAAVVRRILTGCRVFQFHDTSAFSHIRTTSYLRNNRQLMSDGGNLAAFLYMLRETEPEYYRRIVGSIRDVAPHFGDFDLEPEKLNPESILLNWREAGEEYPFGPHQLPDGLLRFMALATLLLQPDDSLPEIIIIDEPELGLHPYAINVLVGLVRKAAVRCQLVLATQSVNLVDQFGPEEVITVERHDGPSVFQRLRPEELVEWLKEYTLSELWEKNVIGGRPTR